LLHSLAPLLIAVPAAIAVAIAIATMLGRILGVDHPDLNFTAAVNGDAEAFYLGQTIDRDPADGYTGQLYTPLFPFLISLLHRVHLWGGWLLLVNYGATLAPVGLVAAVAYDRAASGWDRVLAGVGALGMGLFAWWLVSVIPLNLLFDGRSDHTAWALALLALVLLASRPDPSARRLALVVVLLSAAFWSKQTAVVASAAAVVWMLAGAALGVHRVRAALAFCGGLLLVNLAVLGLLNAATGGWEFRLDFEMAQEHPHFAEFWPSARELARYATPALAFPAVIAAALALRARPWQKSTGGSLTRAVDRARAALGASPDARLAVLLVLFVVVGFPAAAYFRLKVGSEVNQYVGVLWGVGLLGALAWRRARAHTATAFVAAAALGVLFLAAHRPGESYRGFYLPPPERTQVQSDLNVQPQGEIYPNFYNFVDLLAAGDSPDTWCARCSTATSTR
jgi:hypothetical protein